MAKKTNCTVNGKEYYRICRKVGKKVNKKGLWVNDYKNFYGSCKSEAEAAYQKYMERAAKGITSGKCLGQLIDEWIDSIFKHSSLATGTKYGYIRSYIKHFRGCDLAGRMIDEVTPMDLQNFYSDAIKNGTSPGSLKMAHNLLQRFYRYADLNDMGRNITTSVTIPKPVKPSAAVEVLTWNDEELKKIISALEGTTLRFLVVLAVNTGARISELLALTYEDIKGDILYINKQLSDKDVNGNEVSPYPARTKTSGSNRVIPLSTAVLKELNTHRLIHKKEMLKNGYRTSNIFTTSNGSYYYRRNVTRSLQRLYKRIGVPYKKFHAYRHTFGTNLSRAGVPIEETSRLMGHDDISVTMKYYINIDAQRKREAVERIAAFSL